jgi:hypothetical protein
MQGGIKNARVNSAGRIEGSEARNKRPKDQKVRSNKYSLSFLGS